MFIVGYATEAEIALLLERGWEVEDAAKMGRVVGEEAGSMMTAPMQPSPRNTQAVVVFVDASVAEALVALEGMGEEPGCVGPIEGRPIAVSSNGPNWPELPPDEEFLRIVLLESRTMGKDVTVEPYKSWDFELAWRRTDKYSLFIDKKPLNVAQVLELKNEYIRMEQAFRNQWELMNRLLRDRLCSHKRADGSDYTVGVPVSGESWCDACKALID